MKKFIIVLSFLVLALGATPLAFAQDGVETLCLVTDLGRVNDGTFNQFAHEGAVAVSDEYDLEYNFIETQAETDYAANIQTCIDEGFEVVVTVGFLIADNTFAAAEANPDVFFIGVDQFVTEGPENYVGIQFREDEAGFLAGALAAKVAASIESDTVAGVYGIDIPPVKKFRNGFENGARYVNPDINLLGVYIDDFLAPDRGASAAEQFIGEGASVIFGAGGPTGSGGILAAAQQDIFVIGVDQDEWLTSFGAGETPGSEFIISSAIKRVDQGVFDMVAALAEEDMDAFPGGEVYLMDAALNGVGLADKHEADIDDAIYEEVAEINDLLVEGEISTGVDPVSGDLMEDDMMDDMGDDMMMGNTIADIVVASAEAEEAEFTVLLAAVGAADPAIIEALADPEASLTVFAPTDAAFTDLLELLETDAESLLADTDLLSTVLLYHVIDGAVMAETVVTLDGEAVPTLLGEDFTITISVTDDGVVLNDAVNVVVTDIEADNGVIHVIDAVLLPVVEEE